MPIRVNGIAQFSLFVEQLRSVPKESKKAVRKAIVAATADIRGEMARRASWSTRIPGAIGVRTQFSSAQVQIRVNQARAPHARPYEGLSSGSSFRHPVFGNRNVWVAERARPFFFPAIDGNRDRVRDAVERAIIESFPR